MPPPWPGAPPPAAGCGILSGGLLAHTRRRFGGAGFGVGGRDINPCRGVLLAATK